MRIKRTIALVLVIAMLFSLSGMAVSAKMKQVVSIAIQQLGKPYKVLSDPPSSYNCSTLVMYCFNRVSSGTISVKGINSRYKKIKSMSSLQPGDIVFYRISSGRTPKIMNYHFGIYCGKGYFIHASQASGKVIYSKVKSYSGKYLGAIRLY